MSNKKDADKDELPEVQEFLKLSRTVSRQLELFGGLNISPENKLIVEKAAIKLKKTLDNYLEGE